MNAITTEFSFGVKGARPITAYDALVDRLADESELGYLNASRLRALTVTEVAIVKSAKPVDFNDAMARELDSADWPLDRPLVLAARVQMAMEEAARHVLALDVADEIAKREQMNEWERA